MPRVQAVAVGCSAEVPPCSLGHPPSSLQLLVFVLCSPAFLLKPILERAEALASINWDLETVTAGRWDAFSQEIPPFQRLHDPPAFASLLRSSTFRK